MTRRWADPALALALLLVSVIVAAYGPALRAGFVWNDDTYLTDNPVLDAPGGLGLLWTEPRASEQYYPMVFTTFWLEKRFYGLHPFGYHLVNVLLHAGSALLLWALLRRLGLKGAWFAAAAFGLHPVCVESVAWVTERKNTLSLLLSLAAVLAYLAYADAVEARENAPEPRRKRRAQQRPAWWSRPWALYTGALAAFALALFSKTTASVVPGVLAVLVWWRRGRLRLADLRPLLPFVALGTALGLHTAWLETTHVEATGEEWSLGLAGRAVLAGRALAFYAGKALVPVRLAFIYPRFTIDPRAAAQWVPLLGVLAVVAGAWAARARLGRGPLAVVLLFGGVLFPALGFFDVYSMRFSYVADHFAYQAIAVAAAGVVCGAAAFLPESAGPRRAAGAAAVLGIVALGAATFRQSRVYHDEETLWRDTLAKNPGCFMCHTNLGFLLAAGNRVDEAVAHFEESLRLRPDVPTLLNLARVEEQRGRLDAAAERLRAALRIRPSDPTVLVNLATVDGKAGRLDAAIAGYEQALRTPFEDDYVARNGLGVALLRQGRVEEAIEQFRESLRLNPEYDGARANLERALAATGASPR